MTTGARNTVKVEGKRPDWGFLPSRQVGVLGRSVWGIGVVLTAAMWLAFHRKGGGGSYTWGGGFWAGVGSHTLALCILNCCLVPFNCFDVYKAQGTRHHVLLEVAAWPTWP